MYSISVGTVISVVKALDAAGDISEEGYTDINSLALFTDISQESPVG